jgi:dipeptidyl aminopeptidase/acylaminoacyl peptidase
MAVISLRSPHVGGPARGLELAATLYLPDTADGSAAPGLVVGHGASSRRSRHDAFCREACSHGFAVLALDFRGHGDSGGTADGPLEQDILAAAAYLRSHPAVDGSSLCYRGSSMGGFYGLLAAVQTRFIALALLCPATEQVLLDALDDSGERCPGATAEGAAQTRWDLSGLRAYFRAQSSLTSAARVHCPVLLVHARGDSVVPLAHSAALAQHLAGDATLVALAGGTHTSAQHDPAVHRFTARWLMGQVRNACTERT